MPVRRVRFVILCEDQNHDSFVRGYLESFGNDVYRTTRVVRQGEPRGSAEQYVRQQYPAEVRGHRSKANHQSLGLILMTDADHLSVDARRQTLDDSLDEAGQPPRAQDERIVLLIPKWEIETWIHHLLECCPVDEHRKDGYKPKTSREAKKAGRALRAHQQQASEGCCPPSLQNAYAELARLP